MPTSAPSALPDSFCTLAWRYAQVDLQRGKVKACCKTPFHRVSEADLALAGTGAMFNNPRFQERRRAMLRGERPADCISCWDHERLGVPSYRSTAGASPIFATPATTVDAFAEIASARPTHLELILSTVCDLRCVYCDPDFSSSWEAECRRYGPIPGRDSTWDTARAPAPFADAFWSWFDEVASHLRYLQFNGGEPLIQPEFHRALDRIIAAEPPSLQLGVITNLNTPPAAFDRFMTRLPELLDRFDFRIGVSQDSLGARAEYIRYGLRWERFARNLERLAGALRPRPLHLAPTLSALSVSSFADYIDYIGQLGERTGASFFWRPSIVHEPANLSPFTLGASAAEWLESAAQAAHRWGWPELRSWIEAVGNSFTASDGEPRPPGTGPSRLLQSLDGRRGTEAGSTFPELSPWLHDRHSVAD